MPELSRNVRVTEPRPPSAGRAHLGSEASPRPPRPASAAPFRPNPVVPERVARVAAPAAVQEPPRELAQVALAKPKACPPPLPLDVRPRRATPPPLPASAVPVAIKMATAIVRPTLDVEMPDFLDGAARRRRVLLTVSAVAVLVLLAAAIATVASHYRPM